MAAVKGKEELLVNMSDVLTDDKYGHEAKLEALQKIKNIYKQPDRVFSKIRLKFLLESARSALETKLLNKDFLFNYGISLACFVGRDAALQLEILSQMEYVMMELKKHDECQAEALGVLLWNQLEERSIIHSSAALFASKKMIEKMVLDWVSSTGNPHLEFPARVAAVSQQLFQSITAILYEVLVRSHGHGKILEVMQLFISKVMSICMKEGKDFLKLYPNDCHFMVSLLMVNPEICSEDGKETVNHVTNLFLEIFLKEKYKALILLSQYSAWVRPFRRFLKEIGVI